MVEGSDSVRGGFFGRSVKGTNLCSNSELYCPTELIPFKRAVDKVSDPEIVYRSDIDRYSLNMGVPNVDVWLEKDCELGERSCDVAPGNVYSDIYECRINPFNDYGTSGAVGKLIVNVCGEGTLCEEDTLSCSGGFYNSLENLHTSITGGKGRFELDS